MDFEGIHWISPSRFRSFGVCAAIDVLQWRRAARARRRAKRASGCTSWCRTRPARPQVVREGVAARLRRSRPPPQRYAIPGISRASASAPSRSPGRFQGDGVAGRGRAVDHGQATRRRPRRGPCGRGSIEMTPKARLRPRQQRSTVRVCFSPRVLFPLHRRERREARRVGREEVELAVVAST